ncbi:hypothetical protein HK405_011350, partial [Cladochytrium tenue]
LVVNISRKRGNFVAKAGDVVNDTPLFRQNNNIGNAPPVAEMNFVETLNQRIFGRQLDANMPKFLQGGAAGCISAAVATILPQLYQTVGENPLDSPLARWLLWSDDKHTFSRFLSLVPDVDPGAPSLLLHATRVGAVNIVRFLFSAEVRLQTSSETLKAALNLAVDTSKASVVRLLLSEVDLAVTSAMDVTPRVIQSLFRDFLRGMKPSIDTLDALLSSGTGKIDMSLTDAHFFLITPDIDPADGLQAAAA